MSCDKTNLKWLFRIFNRMRHNALKREFKKRGISTASHPHILYTLKYEAKDKGLHQIDLCNKLGLSPSTVAISLKRMEKVGLINKEADKTDQRKNLVKLTKKGVIYIEKCQEAIEAVDKKLLKNFSEAEKKELKKSYLKMIKNLEETGENLPEIISNHAN